MHIQLYKGGRAATNGYLLRLKSRTVLFDAPQGMLTFVIAAGASPDLLVLSHGHFDHLEDAGKLQQHFGLQIAAMRAEKPVLRNPLSIGASDPDLDQFEKPDTLDAFEVDHWLPSDGACLEQLPGRLLCLPGHSPGSLVWHLPESGVCFSGDLLMHRQHGSWQVDYGNRHLLGQSLQWIAGLPPETRILPGHGEETTLAAERWLARIARRLTRDL